MGKNKVATAKHMHCQVIYSTRGGSHIQLHRPILEGALLLCSIQTPFVVFVLEYATTVATVILESYGMYMVQAPPRRHSL